jgi:hypothetical protein
MMKKNIGSELRNGLGIIIWNMSASTSYGTRNHHYAICLLWQFAHAGPAP